MPQKKQTSSSIPISPDLAERYKATYGEYPYGYAPPSEADLVKGYAQLQKSLLDARQAQQGLAAIESEEAILAGRGTRTDSLRVPAFRSELMRREAPPKERPPTQAEMERAAMGRMAAGTATPADSMEVMGSRYFSRQEQAGKEAAVATKVEQAAATAARARMEKERETAIRELGAAPLDPEDPTGPRIGALRARNLMTDVAAGMGPMELTRKYGVALLQNRLVMDRVRQVAGGAGSGRQAVVIPWK